jgi:hypothetical protein
VIEVLGWAGAGALLLAYGLVASGRLSGVSARCHALNLFGGAALAVNSGVNGAWPSAALNVVWLGIGGWALLRPRRPVGGGQVRA